MAEVTEQKDDIGAKKQQGDDSDGFWAKLSLWQKILLGILILTFIVIAWSFLFGGINSIWELAFIVMLTIVLGGIGYVVIIAGEIFFRPTYYSPKEDYFTRIVNMAIDYCPSNLNEVWFQGDKDKRAVLGGKVIGCLGVPYFIGRPKQDENGKQLYMESKLLDMKIPIFEKIEFGKDGDTLIVYQKGWFVFKKRHYLRCNRQLHSTLNGDITIYDINPVPYGKFFEYPFKQLQRDPGKIMIQSQLEVILATHEHQGDLISQSADAGIYYNPIFKMLKEGNSEISRD